MRIFLIFSPIYQATMWFVQNGLWKTSDFSFKLFHYHFGEIVEFMHTSIWLIICLTISRMLIKQYNFFGNVSAFSNQKAFITAFLIKVINWLMVIHIVIIIFVSVILYLFAEYGFTIDLITKFDESAKIVNKTGLYSNTVSTELGAGAFVIIFFIICTTILSCFNVIFVTKPISKKYRGSYNFHYFIIIHVIINILIIKKGYANFTVMFIQELDNVNTGISMFCLFSKYEFIVQNLFYNFVFIVIIFFLQYIIYAKNKQLFVNKKDITNVFSKCFIKDIISIILRYWMFFSIYNIGLSIFYLYFQYPCEEFITAALILIFYINAFLILHSCKYSKAVCNIFYLLMFNIAKGTSETTRDALYALMCRVKI